MSQKSQSRVSWWFGVAWSICSRWFARMYLTTSMSRTFQLVQFEVYTVHLKNCLCFCKTCGTLVGLIVHIHLVFACHYFWDKFIAIQCNWNYDMNATLVWTSPVGHWHLSCYISFSLEVNSININKDEQSDLLILIVYKWNQNMWFTGAAMLYFWS